MKYQLLTILLFFCIQQNLHSINNQEVKSENDSTFLKLIEPYCRTDFPLYCTDLDYGDNTDELEPTNFELQMNFLVNISAISKLSKFLVYVDGNIVGSSYAINKLRAFKRPGTSNFVLLFYIKGSWDLSRSLVYAVLDSSGNEAYSQVLVTEDPVIEDNPDRAIALYDSTKEIIDTFIALKIDSIKRLYKVLKIDSFVNFNDKKYNLIAITDHLDNWDWTIISEYVADSCNDKLEINKS